LGVKRLFILFIILFEAPDTFGVFSARPSSNIAKTSVDAAVTSCHGALWKCHVGNSLVAWNQPKSKTMRIRTSLSVILLALSAASCQIPYTAYCGSNDIPGQVGTLRVVKGIEVWEDGRSQRACEVLGVLHDDGKSQSALAHAAHKRGGNLLIHGGVDHFGHVDLHMRNRWLVAKYVQ
jgi:hypothetical protein